MFEPFCADHVTLCIVIGNIAGNVTVFCICGMNDHIAKPVDISVLIAVISKYIER